MSDILLVVGYLIGVIQGWTIVYIWWSLSTEFKRKFIERITLKFLWNRK